jgi:exosome complex exonuclease DIS3/RRP44
MLNRTYVRLGKKNKILTVLKEVYLRKDIFCGSELCPNCYTSKTLKASIVDGHTHAQRLSSAPKGSKKPVDYLVIDTNIVLHQMDILNKQNFTNVVVLQTVLSEVKNQSPQLYSDLRELCSDPEKRFYVFSNEFREETHIERTKGETPNDRNDRAIRVAAKWYQSHLSGLKCRVLLITNDRDNCAKARAEGIEAMTIYEYVRQLGDADLLDTLSSEREEYDLKSHVTGEAIYEEHWTEEQVKEARKSVSLDSRRVFQGIMRQSADNWLEAIVPLNSPVEVGEGETCEEIFINGRIAMNRAIDGDIVLVELLPRSSWSSRSNIFVDADTPEEEIMAFESNDARGKRIGGSAASSAPIPSGRVVAVMKRNWRPYVGTLEPAQTSSRALVTQEELKKAHQLIFVPLDRRVPKIKIMSRQYDTLKSQRVVVSIDGWEKYSLLPHGHYVRALGQIGDKSVEAEALLQQHDLHLRPFSAQIMAELPPPETELSAEGRLDLRSELICSIDPPGCTDIDDALHVRLLPNGNYQIGVHIADVSHYVKEGSFMDREARKRGNTIYLVDRRIDMLPKELGEDMCSINSNVDRYAFSVLWEVTPPNDEPQKDGSEDGFGVRFVDVAFHKTVIRSRANLSYGEAQFRIDDPSQQDPLTQNIRVLNKIAKVLKRRRITAGALSLASPQVRFVKDESTHDPIDLEMYESKEANSLVEEFMLLANIAVAEQITKFFPAFALLRRHPPPNQSKFDALAKSMRRFNVSLDTSSSKRLSESLEENVGKTSDPFFNKLLRIMVTRCMNTARYFSSGTLVPSQFHHYGLAAPIYTHFTSPIRRYADVVVHRLLAASINYVGLEGSLNAKQVQRTSDVINRRHRMAEYAGRDSVRYHTIQFFKGKVMPVQPAYVLALAANGFDILVPAFGIEGKVYIGGKGAIQGVENASEWTFSTHEQRLYHKANGIEINIFDQVQVELCVDEQKPHALKLAFRCVSPALHEPFAVVPLTPSSKQEKSTGEGSQEAESKSKPTKKRKSTPTAEIPSPETLAHDEPDVKKPRRK